MHSPLGSRTRKVGFDLRKFEAVLVNDDGQAAKDHLLAGHPIYYSDDRYPEGVIKKCPTGQLQLVSLDATGKLYVIRDL